MCTSSDSRSVSWRAPLLWAVALCSFAGCSERGDEAKTAQTEKADTPASAPDTKAAAPRPKVAEAAYATSRIRYDVVVNGLGTFVIRANGAAVCRPRPGEETACFGAHPVTSWVWPGKNQIRVEQLATEPNQRDADIEIQLRKAHLDPKFRARVLQTHTLAAAALPRKLEFNFELTNDVPPCRLFRDAEVLADDAGTRAAALAFARKLRSAREGGDETALARMVEYSVRDLARCSNEPTPDFGPDDLAAHPWTLEPLRPDALTLEHVAGGYAYEVLDAGGPLLNGEHGGDRSWAWVFIGRIDGRWMQVR